MSRAEESRGDGDGQVTGGEYHLWRTFRPEYRSNSDTQSDFTGNLISDRHLKVDSTTFLKFSTSLTG